MNDAYSIRDYGLARLADQESLSDILQSFGELLQTGIALYEMDGQIAGELTIHGETPCAAARRAHPDRVPCDPVTLKVLSSAKGPSPVFTPCPMGMLYASAIFTVEGEQLGRLVVGPFVPTDDPPPGSLASELLGDGAAAAFMHVRRLSRHRAEVYLRALQRVLGAVAYATYKAGITSQVHLESIRNAYVELEVANRRLEKALHTATEANRLKSAFLATVSHELKTPLTSILGYSEMLMDGTAGPLSDSQGEYARTIFEKGEALQRLIGRVLELTRLESGSVTPLFKPGRLDAVAGPVVSTHRVTAAAKGVALKIEIPAGLPEFTFDHEKIRATLDGLIDNGVKFTPPGGSVTVTAAIVSRRPRRNEGRFGAENEPHLRIAVADTGPGIPSGMRTKIFDPFYQIDSSDTREHGGMGIGLRLVKGYIDIHGGDIELDSGMDRGTTISVYLPLRPPDQQAAIGAAAPAVRT